jgi:transglutaminase-like putative cysteine protease
MTRSDPGTALAAGCAVLLGSLALTPVYASLAWLPPVVFAVAVLVLGGMLLRWAGPRAWFRLFPDRPVPGRLAAAAVPLAPLGQLALLACVLTTVFVPTHAFAGVVPTWTSLRDLFGLFSDGNAEMQEQAVPALTLQGLVALTVLLVGVVAVVVDVVAVAGQQPALAGLGLLVVFCVPVATIQGGIGWVALVAPAAGLGLLLWADQRRRLARRTPGRRSALGTGTLAALRIGAVALAVGIVVGGVVPILAEGSFGHGIGVGGTGSGITSTGTSLDPIATLHGQLTRPEAIPLMRLRASVSDPGYLRSVSLDRYDSRDGWSLGSLDGEASVTETPRLAALPSREPSRQVNGRITVLNLNDRFLPVLTSPVRVNVSDPQAWRYDPTTGTVFGRGATTSGRSYSVTADEPRPTTALLESEPALSASNPIQQRYTQLPALPAEVSDLVSSLTGDAGSPYARVRAILDYFTDPANGFVYSLSTTPGTSGDHLLDFLHFKRGYCEQYAGAMAVMVRAAGVPARVALGYVPGSSQQAGTRLITSDDAHAWVEVYFSDLGWVPFDPTPLAANRAVTLPWAPRVTPNTTLPQATDPGAAGARPSGPTRGLDRADQAIPALRPLQKTPGWVRPAAIAGGATLLVLLLVAAPALGRIRRRRRRLADGSPGALWDELLATARDLGIPLAAARTPRQTARDLAGLMAGSADRPAGPEGGRTRRPDPARLGIEGVRRLALAEEAATFAPPGRAATAEQLRPFLRAARQALLGATPLRGRLRALLWPASLLAERRERWAVRLSRPAGWLHGRTA